MTASGPPPILDYDAALRLLLERTPTLEAQSVDLPHALGRALREPILADRDQPPFHRSAMDGYALRAADFAPGSSLPLAADIPAGAPGEAPALAPGQACAIATGAPLPPGADAVVPVERSRRDPAANPPTVAFDIARLAPWDNVHRRASDAPAGQTLVPPGARLAPHHLGLAAAVGATPLRVGRLPRIILLSTGDEVRPADTPAADLAPSHIRNANAPMLAALLAALGFPLVEHRHLPDDPEVILCAARECLGNANLVVTIGGVSVGQRDFLPSAWKHLGLHTLFHGVNIQPGKPVMAVVPLEPDDPRLVLGLPGNPVSVLCCAHLFLVPALQKMAGLAPSPEGGILRWRLAPLAHEAAPSPKREVFRAARLNPDGSAQILPWHGSGDLAHTASADGWLRLARQSEPIPAGTPLPFLPMVGR